MGRPKGPAGPTRTCQNCDKKFEEKRRDRISKYCSKECYYQSRRGTPCLARRRRRIKACEWCGKEFETGGNTGKGKKYCSHRCLAFGRGKQGGRHIRRDGYVWIRNDSHLFAAKNRGERGFVLEHRLVMEQKLGRLLRPNETVHHLNGIRDDNRIENLELRQGKHGKGHVMVCLDCGSHNIGPEPHEE